MSQDDLMTLMREAVGDAPPREWSLDGVRRAARARRVRRRTWGALGLTSAAVAAVAAASTLGSSPALPTQPEQSAAAAASGLAVGFPVGAAVEAVVPTLPADAEVGELPRDIAWRDGALEVPLVVRGSSALLSLVATDAGCRAQSPALDEATLARVAAAVCAARDQYLAQPPAAPVPGGGGPAS